MDVKEFLEIWVLDSFSTRSKKNMSDLKAKIEERYYMYLNDTWQDIELFHVKWNFLSCYRPITP